MRSLAQFLLFVDSLLCFFILVWKLMLQYKGTIQYANSFRPLSYKSWGAVNIKDQTKTPGRLKALIGQNGKVLQPTPNPKWKHMCVVVRVSEAGSNSRA